MRNIVTFGDTDIFPYSFEQYIFHDRTDLVERTLEDLHRSFDDELNQTPPDNINTLAPAGYTGFRWATQIDPLWNAYYLALLVDIGAAIEKARIPVSENAVFSYRFRKPDPTGRIFDDSVTWRAFMERSHAIAEELLVEVAPTTASGGDGASKALRLPTESRPPTNVIPHILMCDISDFYARIYHHRIENALYRLNTKSDTAKRIMSLLQVFSGTTSYGLPVGGPASRLLAELALNDVDNLLKDKQIRFCRFVDDYRIFCKSKEEAYQNLIFLSDKLANEGLSLQKSKTRILSAKEFLGESRVIFKSQHTNETELSEEDKLSRLSINFDPYSGTASEDYERIKSNVSRIDVAGILSRELEKTRIDQFLTRQAISTLQVIEAGERRDILTSLLSEENIHKLAPIFPRLMTVLKSIYLELDDATQDMIDHRLASLVDSSSYIVKLDLNLAYLIQVLRRRCTQRTRSLFSGVFETSTSPLVRREIIVAWVLWEQAHSLTDLKKHFKGLSKWERRAFIFASYVLGDEGSHWRRFNNGGFDFTESVVQAWSCDRKNARVIL